MPADRRGILLGDAGECCDRVLEEHNAEATNQYVIGISTHRAGLGVALHKADVRRIGVNGESPRDLQHEA
jgi:hypothetical protein